MKEKLKRIYSRLVLAYYEISVKLHIWCLNKRLEKRHQQRLEELQKPDK